MVSDPSAPNPSLLVEDHPGSLGPLADIFDRRRIAVGIDSSGNVVLCRPDTVLAEIPADSETRKRLAAHVGKDDPRQGRWIEEVSDEYLPRFATVQIEPAREMINGERRWTLRPAIELLNKPPSAGPAPSELNHVFLGAQTVSGNPLGLPATWAGEMAFLGRVVKSKDGRNVMLSLAEPETRPRFLRQRLDLEGRRRPRILVLDTGLRTVLDGGARKPEHPHLGRCRLHEPWHDPVPSSSGQFPVDDEDEPDDDRNGTLDFEAGHGTFISGVISQVCPDAEVHVTGVLSSFGDGDVADVVHGLARSVSRRDAAPYDIVVMSFGAFFADDDPGIFGREVLRLLGNALGVAAAGNQVTCRPYFPAGMDDVIGVGGLAADGRAWFSNFGGWVDACAPAVDVVSTFFTEFTENLGQFPDLEDQNPRSYNGWARWSGTSFSAPKVAAVVAQEMYLNVSPDGDLISAQDAWRRLSTHKHLRMPDLGVVFNV
jgi:hypothetical protein